MIPNPQSNLISHLSLSHILHSGRQNWLPDFWKAGVSLNIPPALPNQTSDYLIPPIFQTSNASLIKWTQTPTFPSPQSSESALCLCVGFKISFYSYCNCFKICLVFPMAGCVWVIAVLLQWINLSGNNISCAHFVVFGRWLPVLKLLQNLQFT